MTNQSKDVSNSKGSFLKKYGVIILGVIIGIAWIAIENISVNKDYSIIKIPDKSNMNLVSVNIEDAEFMYDSNMWTVDTSSKPYTFYFNESITDDVSANFAVYLGGEFDYKLNDKLLEEIVNAHFKMNPFIDITLSELRELNGELVAYVENDLEYTDETINMGIKSGVVTEEMIAEAGGREVFINLPPLPQLTVFSVIDEKLWLFTGAYINEDQKAAMIDAIAVANETFQVIH